MAVAIAGAVLAQGSWRNALLAIGAVGLLVMLPIGLATLRDRDTAAAAPDASAPTDAAHDLDARAALRTRSFWILTVTLLSFWLYFIAMLDHLVLFLTDEGVEDARSYFGHAILLGILGKLGFGWIADRLRAKRAMLLDYGLLACSSALLLVLPEPTLLILFVVTYGLSVAARDVVTPLCVIHCFGVKDLARIYGLLMLTLLPGGTLGPIFAGAVHDRTGSYELAFQLFAILNVVSFLLLMFLRDERPTAGLASA